MTGEPDAPYETIHLRRGEFKVHKDCRVKLYDAFVETEPSLSAENWHKWLKPNEFSFEQWDALSDGEKLLSVEADRSELKAQIEQLTGTKNSLLVAVFALCMTLVVLTVS